MPKSGGGKAGSSRDNRTKGAKKGSSNARSKNASPASRVKAALAAEKKFNASKKKKKK